MERINLPSHILKWVEKEFNEKYVSKIYDRMINVMSGNAKGNNFEKKAATFLMDTYNGK